eukprot:RCo025634
MHFFSTVPPATAMPSSPGVHYDNGSSQGGFRPVGSPSPETGFPAHLPPSSAAQQMVDVPVDALCDALGIAPSEFTMEKLQQLLASAPADALPTPSAVPFPRLHVEAPDAVHLQPTFHPANGHTPSTTALSASQQYYGAEVRFGAPTSPGSPEETRVVAGNRSVAQWGRARLGDIGRAQAAAAVAAAQVPAQGLGSAGTSGAAAVPRPSAGVVAAEEGEAPPCEHFDHWRRLRVKKGISHFICYHCGARWRARWSRELVPDFPMAWSHTEARTAPRFPSARGPAPTPTITLTTALHAPPSELFSGNTFSGLQHPSFFRADTHSLSLGASTHSFGPSSATVSPSPSTGRISYPPFPRAPRGSVSTISVTPTPSSARSVVRVSQPSMPLT